MIGDTMTVDTEFRLAKAAAAFALRNPELGRVSRNPDEALSEVEEKIAALSRLPPTGFPNSNTGLRLARAWRDVRRRIAGTP